MNYRKFKEILNKFSKNEIINLLGDKIYDSIKEWTDSEDAHTQSSLVDILISINGFGLFKNKDFRQSFFEFVSLSDLQKLLNTNSSDYAKLAKQAAKIEFVECDFYRTLFDTVLDSPNYEFDSFENEEIYEEVNGSEERFFELLDYQYLIKQQAVYELNKKGQLGRKILIHMPTGTGKTKTTMHILAHYLNFIKKDGLIMWVAHTKELLGQALETFKNVWGHLGLRNTSVEKSWGSGVYTISNGVIFITIQALQAMRKSNKTVYSQLCKKVSLMVYDECHKIGAKETNKVIQDFSKSYEGNKKDFIGLTATPGRTTEDSLENRIFNEFFDRKIGIDIKLVDRISMGQNQARNRVVISDVIGYFQDRKILSKLIKEPLEYEVDNELLEKLKKEFYSNREDYSPELITQIAANKSRNSVILNRLKELNTQGKPTIVFACSLDHAKMLSAFLNIENIPNSLVYGDMSAATRKKAIADFKDRDNPVNIIINYDILTTGFDSTNIDCVFITRPTKSVILYSQMIGRGLRGPQMGGAETCLLIDVKENLDVYNENEAFSHFNSYWR